MWKEKIERRKKNRLGILWFDRPFFAILKKYWAGPAQLPIYISFHFAFFSPMNLLSLCLHTERAIWNIYSYFSLSSFGFSKSWINWQNCGKWHTTYVAWQKHTQTHTFDLNKFHFVTVYQWISFRSHQVVIVMLIYWYVTPHRVISTKDGRLSEDLTRIRNSQT